MNSPLDEASRSQTEFQLLRALCQGTLQGSARAAAIRKLADYAWREPVHQALFSCLVQMRTGNFETLRNELPACLTRKGFPDVDWENLFASGSYRQEQFEKLMLDLKRFASSRG